MSWGTAAASFIIYDAVKRSAENPQVSADSGPVIKSPSTWCRRPVRIYADERKTPSSAAVSLGRVRVHDGRRIIFHTTLRFIMTKTVHAIGIAKLGSGRTKKPKKKPKRPWAKRFRFDVFLFRKISRTDEYHTGAVEKDTLAVGGPFFSTQLAVFSMPSPSHRGFGYHCCSCKL